MKESRLRRLQYGVIWGGLIALFLASPSFAQAQSEKRDPLTVEKIEVTVSGPGSRVVIEGSAPFEYTVFKGANPDRVIVDLPKAQIGKLAGPIEVRNGTINVIRNRQTDYGSRVEIGIDQDIEYQVASEDNYLYIEFGAPTAPPLREMKAQSAPSVKPAGLPASTEKAKESSNGQRAMKEIAVTEKGDLLEVNLKADETLGDYRSFQLTRPPRLVVDLPKVTNATSKRIIDVGNPLLKDIRIGQYPEKVRLVFTFPGTKIPPYQMAKEGEGLKVVLGQEKPKPDTSVPPVAKAAPAPPVAVAQIAPAPPAPMAAPPAPLAQAVSPVVEKKGAERKMPENTPEPAPAAVAQKGNGPEKEPMAEEKVSERDKAQLNSYRGAKISLDFKDADIHNIFRLIAEVSSLNIITTDDVKGRVTVRLVNVPWDQALDVILQTKNLIKIEEGNVLRITTLESVRKEREEREKEQEIRVKSIENKEKVEDLVTQEIRLNYAKALDIMRLILGVMPPGAGAAAMPPPGAGGATAARGLLGPRGSVRADERTNIVILRDTASRVEDIKAMVRKLDFPTPQVLIEARVVQAVTTFARSVGVQWGGSYNQTPGGNWAYGLTGLSTAAAGFGFSPGGTNSSGVAVPPSNISVPSSFVVNFPASTAATNVGGMGVSFGKLTGSLVNLDLRLQLGETEGQTKVIARPKLATLNNTKAHIKQGELIPYETTSQAGTQVQFIDAVLLLEVTPLVTPDGSIKMLVKVTRDARGSFRTQINQVPSVDKREASTEVLVKDGETVVIGGIYESENTETTAGIPWIKDVPILGWLFKTQETTSTKRELLIFITPTILQLKGNAES